MSRRSLGWTVFLVAGVPILVTLLTLLKEVVDIGVMDTQNPLGEVAETLLDRVDHRFRDGAKAVDWMASAITLSSPDDPISLKDFAAHVGSGPFLALAHLSADGVVRETYPEAFSGWGESWLGLEVQGLSELISHPDGDLAVAIAAPLDSGGRVVGLFDVSTVLGTGEVRRMQVAASGEAFVADGAGRVILSANAHLLGRNLAELGLTRAGAGPTAAEPATADDAVSSRTHHWTAPDGTLFLVGMAHNPGWFQGPHQHWQVGLAAPREAFLARNQKMRRRVILIMVVVTLITLGMIAVLRRSLIGRKP